MIDPWFLVSTLFRYGGPIVLAILAVEILGDQAARALFIVFSGLIFAVTLGKFGADNQIVKQLRDSDLKIGLCLTVFAWLPVSGFFAGAVISYIFRTEVAILGIGNVEIFFMYMTLTLCGIIAGLLKSRSSVRFVQVFEFGFFQAVLALAMLILAATAGAGTDPRRLVMSSLWFTTGAFATLAIIYIAQNRETFTRMEVLSLRFFQERLNCTVPNIITYVSSWGLLLPLYNLPADDFTDINTALRIAAISTAIISVSSLIAIGRHDISVADRFKLARRFGLLILVIALIVIVPVYVIVDSTIISLPDPESWKVFLIYGVHAISVLIGPAMFFANVQSNHLRINITLVVLFAIIAISFLDSVHPIMVFFVILIYTRIISRIVLTI